MTHRLSVLALLVVLAAPCLLAFAPPRQSTLDLSVSAGYGGVYRRGQWVAVRVTVSNSGESLSGTLQVRPDSSGSLENAQYRTPLDLPRGGRKQVFIYVAPEPYTRNLRVEVLDSKGRVIVSRPLVLRMAEPEDVLLAVVTESPLGAVDLTASVPGVGTAYQVNWRVTHLPPLAEALAGLDVLLIHDADTGALSIEQVRALERWVLSGGHLIVAGGDAWQRTTAGIVQLLPVELQGSAVGEGLESLATFARLPAGALRESTVITRTTPRPGARILVEQDDLPLVVRQSFGAGLVDFLAADPQVEPLRSWAGLARLWHALIAWSGQRPSWAHGISDWTAARQGTLTLFHTVLPGLLQLCAFLLAYIILVGPANYALLRWLNRREWAWVSTPVLILLFSVLAYQVGFNLRGNAPTITRLTVIRQWPGQSEAQVTALVGVQSPRRASYDVVAGHDFTLRPLPDSGIGTAVTVEEGTRYAALAVPIDGGMVASFVTEGFALALPVDAAATWTLAGGYAPRLTGHVTNESDVLWRDAVLLIKGEARYLGDLAPGQTATFDLAIGPQDPGPLTLGSALSRNLYLWPSWQFSRQMPGWCFDYRGLGLTLSDVMQGARFTCAARDVSRQEQEIRRRYRLLAALAVDYDLSGGRGMGAYLFAWSDSTLAEIEMPGTSPRTEDTTLLIVEIPAGVSAAGELVQIPPALTTWAIAETRDPRTLTTIMPDSFEIPEGSQAVFQFRPMPPLLLAEVQAVDVLFEGQGALLVEVWDWEAEQWRGLEFEADATVVRLSPADRYVGPGGAVNVRVSSTGGLAYNNVDYVRVAYQGRLAP
ncbi:MAG: hypothetical protein Kow00106_15160 [Anaerolineae bacterium]